MKKVKEKLNIHSYNLLYVLAIHEELGIEKTDSEERFLL